MKISLISAPF